MANLPLTLTDYLDDESDPLKQQHTKLEFAMKRHTKYFQMCLNVLPSRLQSEDSNKLALIYFCLNALDMLHSVDSVVNKSGDRKPDILQWIYSHYNGDGFRGSLTHLLESSNGTVANKDTEQSATENYKNRKNDDNNGSYDPANLAATYFALCILSILKDTQLPQKLDRFSIMNYVKRCQLPNGSFTSILDIYGNPYGEHDLRLCLVAASIRKLLQFDNDTITDDERKENDIDVDKLEEHILSCLAYSGGFGGRPHLEVHAGYTFCGLAALKLINRLPFEQKTRHNKSINSASNNNNSNNNNLNSTDPDFSKTIGWLARRQLWFNEYNRSEFETNEFFDIVDLGGMNGRENKYADTCYAFWVAGSLDLLGHLQIIHLPALEHYMLSGTQNLLVGGFSKVHEEMPDPYHSSLGITALKLAGSQYLEGVKEVDVELVLTKESKEFILGLDWNSSGNVLQ